MFLHFRPLAIIFLILIIGCASAPKETVELAEIVDQQIAQMQVSHEKFVSLYYAKLRDDINNFMEQKWIPLFLSNVVEGKGEEGKKFRDDLDVAYKLSTLDWESAVKINNIHDEDVKSALRDAIQKMSTSNNATLGMVLLDFSVAVQEQINKRRKTLIKPINEQEAYVLARLRQGYADLLRGSTAIKGYLASTVKLVEQRDAVLEKLGVLKTQRKIVNLAVKLNDGAVMALENAGKVEEGIDNFVEKMEKVKKKLKKIEEGEITNGI
jgi:hypothetical protein